MYFGRGCLENPFLLPIFVRMHKNFDFFFFFGRKTYSLHKYCPTTISVAVDAKFILERKKYKVVPFAKFQN